MLIRLVATTFAVAAMIVPAIAGEPVLLYAAGSLRSSLSEAAAAFEAATGINVRAKYGASGTLRNEIMDGAGVDIFASANMEHPQALAAIKKGGAVVMFARNRLCALVKPGLAVTQQNLLDRMLDPSVKLGTSTPRADPSGDYAWEVFRKAERVKPGAFSILERKALQLVGGPDAPVAAPGRTVYAMLVADGRADIFLTYCTNVTEALKENAEFSNVTLPDEIAVGAEYGLTVITGAPTSAYQFAIFLLSTKGQHVLAKHGFAAPNLPQ